jgi:hypothetical protein
VDLWLDDGPARALNSTDYEEALFERHLHAALDEYAAQGGPRSRSQPLFVHYAPHLVVRDCVAVPRGLPPLPPNHAGLLPRRAGGTDNQTAPPFSSVAFPLHVVPRVHGAVRAALNTRQHDPYEVPSAWLAKFDFIRQRGDDTHGGLRQVYAAMTHYLDSVVGNLTEHMKSLDLWEHTLVVGASDNVRAASSLCYFVWCGPSDLLLSGGKGVVPMLRLMIGAKQFTAAGVHCGSQGGPVQGGQGASNWPLRSGKFSTFEGGMRVNAFLGGGYLPDHARGTISTQLMHVADIWATLAEVVGQPVEDPVAAAAGLAPLDSISFWSSLVLRNQSAQRRQGLLVGSVWWEAGGLKLHHGGGNAIWQGPRYPNASTNFTANAATNLDCGRQGCLFDVLEVRTNHCSHLSEPVHPSVSVRVRRARLTETERDAACLCRPAPIAIRTQGSTPTWRHCARQISRGCRRRAPRPRPRRVSTRAESSTRARAQRSMKTAGSGGHGDPRVRDHEGP